MHVLTFNDYLARRDAAWMGPVYETLGLTTGVVVTDLKGKVTLLNRSAAVLSGAARSAARAGIRGEVGGAP